MSSDIKIAIVIKNHGFNMTVGIHPGAQGTPCHAIPLQYAAREPTTGIEVAIINGEGRYGAVKAP